MCPCPGPQRISSAGSIDIDITSAQAEYLDWWVTPNKEKVPRAQHAVAEQLGVSEETLRRWRKTDWWEKALRQRLAELNVSPDRVQSVIDALFETATDRDNKQQVAAARVLLEYTQQLMPIQPVLPQDRPVELLTDEELEQLTLAEEQRARDSAAVPMDVQPKGNTPHGA